MKISRLTILFLFAGLIMLLNSCIPSYEKGSGNVVTKTFILDDFDKIDIRGMGDVYITQSDTQSVLLTTDDNMLELLDFRVYNRELIIDVKHAIINPTLLKIEISLPELHAIHASGSVKLVTDGIIKTDNMEIYISGSGKLELDMTAENLLIKTSGVGNVSLSGFAKSLVAKISGTGTIDGLDFTTEEAKVSISGTAKVDLVVTRKLDAKVSGSGRINYKGNPEVKSKISGSGSVNAVK